MPYHTENNLAILKRLATVFPTLDKCDKKGKNGRIGVIGGSFEFTGAPYYSAIAALRVGADLSHIFCSKFSSAAIKSYSPEIITHPLFISEEEVKYTEVQQQKMFQSWSQKIKSWQKAIHSWVIGPGLGRDLYMHKFFPQLIKGLPSGCVVIIDADGIFYLDQHPELFRELQRFRTIITPNYRELGFLQKYFRIDPIQILEKWNPKEEVTVLPSNLNNPPIKIIVKGRCDIVLSQAKSFIIGTEGGHKRCGGMGDILAGVTGTCGLWDFEYGPPLASLLVKEATRKAYEHQGRGMTAPSVIEELTSVVKRLELLV